MATISVEIATITEGRGLSFKKGLCTTLLQPDVELSFDIDPTHMAAYKRGQESGIQLKAEIAELVKKPFK